MARGQGPEGRRDSQPRLNSAFATALPVITARDQKLPLYRLLDRIADPELNERYKDTLCVAILPCMHSRMPSFSVIKMPFHMTDDELLETRRILLEHRQQTALGRGPVVESDVEATDVSWITPV